MSRPPSSATIRRSLVKNLIGAAVAVALFPSRQSRSAELPHLDVTDPQAVALAYVESASQVDAKKNPIYVKGSRCDNCLLLQGTSGTNYRPCNLFAGKLVSASGWCSGWTAEI